MKHTKTSLSKLFQNRLFLNFVFILALLTFFGNLIYLNLNAVSYFILLAWLSSFFSRNMTIILLVPVIFVNIYTKFIQPQYQKEGLENNNVADASGNNLTNQQKIELMKKKNSDSSNTDSSLPIVPAHEQNSSTTDETFTNNDSRNQNKKKKYNIDYASTVEEAYDNLNQVIGGEGIKNLTKDTQRLMKQQLQLTEALKNMGPLMESMGPLLGQANTLLKSFGGAESLQGLGDLANTLAPK